MGGAHQGQSGDMQSLGLRCSQENNCNVACSDPIIETQLSDRITSPDPVGRLQVSSFRDSHNRTCSVECSNHFIDPLLSDMCCRPISVENHELFDPNVVNETAGWLMVLSDGILNPCD